MLSLLLLGNVFGSNQWTGVSSFGTVTTPVPVDSMRRRDDTTTSGNTPASFLPTEVTPIVQAGATAPSLARATPAVQNATASLSAGGVTDLASLQAFIVNSNLTEAGREYALAHSSFKKEKNKAVETAKSDLKNTLQGEAQVRESALNGQIQALQGQINSSQQELSQQIARLNALLTSIAEVFPNGHSGLYTKLQNNQDLSIKKFNEDNMKPKLSQSEINALGDKVVSARVDADNAKQGIVGIAGIPGIPGTPGVPDSFAELSQLACENGLKDILNGKPLPSAGLQTLMNEKDALTVNTNFDVPQTEKARTALVNAFADWVAKTTAVVAAEAVAKSAGIDLNTLQQPARGAITAVAPSAQAATTSGTGTPLPASAPGGGTPVNSTI